MAKKTWEVSKVCYCEHVGQKVALETELVYPAEFLPDQPPRVRGHRCSHGVNCNRMDKAACVWAGTNPDYDPFQG